MFKRVMQAVDTRQIIPKDASGSQHLIDPADSHQEREKQRETLGNFISTLEHGYNQTKKIERDRQHLNKLFDEEL